ncbi:MAG: hypothetical protein IJG63_03015 [Oscillospiraceae bacterium]|nr:hypothetical protein [Oscillospiraceae bacterium]
MKEKTKNIIACILAVLLLAGVCGSTAVSVSTMRTMNSMREDMDRVLNRDVDVPQEDDVTIAGSYVIKSTTDISDAYKSGDTSALDDKQKETLDMASKVLDSIIRDGMSDYEKELAVYDWMTGELQNDQGLLTVIPSTSADCDNPYGVLKYHNAVCVGYATTFRLFMQMLDIPCMVVHNTDMYHSWDMVQLDGEWYHTDIYSDAGSGNHSNFNMNDTLCSSGHSWNTDFFPAADGIKYNYGYQNRVMVEDKFEIPAMMKEALEAKEGAMFLGFGPEFTEEDAQVVEAMLNGIESVMNDSEEYWQLWTSHNWVPIGREGYLLQISIEDYSEGGSPDYELSDEDIAGIEESISEAFDVDYVYSEDSGSSDEYYYADDGETRTVTVTNAKG